MSSSGKDRDWEAFFSKELTAQKRSLASYQGWLTKAAASAAKLADGAAAKASEMMLRQLELQRQQVENAYETYELCALKMQERAADADSAAEFDGLLQERADQRDEAIGLLMTASAAVAKALEPAVLPTSAHHSHGATERPKPNTALKPTTLTEDNSYIELRQWSRQFNAYYTSSKFEQASRAEQHAYFMACVDARLQERLRPLITETTPALGDTGSLMAAIRGIFDNKYPLFLRRL
jgi:hypothetical protein